MLSSLIVIPLLFGASVVAQSSSSSVVCVAGQCLQGYTNTTIGVTLSAPGTSSPVLLLPSQYQSTTNPELLHQLLTSSSSSLSPSPGFSNASSVSLPLNVALEPGLSVYPQALYSGSGQFSELPSTAPPANLSTSLSEGSIALSSDIWAAVNQGSSNNRIILWSSVPDVSQLPSSSSGSLSLLQVQSASCSPPCAGAGMCTSSGTCSCPKGFNGTSCETCADGFFGPSCQACPEGCTDCDDGVSGSGRCLSAVLPTSAPGNCNCINGACGSNGQCECNAGWTNASNGTQCAVCEEGFFLTSDGSCQICQLGCTSCADVTGDCSQCASGFSLDANDRTKCDAVASTTSSGTVCPSGSFSNGAACEPCSPTCSTCTGATSNDCVVCAQGTFKFNGSCVATNADGVCEGTGGLIGNNDNKECDACGAKCTACAISGFSVASTINQLQCTDCLPGFVLANGECVESCPSGTFLSPTDNLTCTACDTSCSTCAGAANFCLTCTGNQFASIGQCVSSCPSNTFSSGGACLSCHPDCATCSSGAFNQCSSCGSQLPVLTNGRCLPTCSQAQFFDKTSSSCQACDSSCSSCSGEGPENCLACSSSSQVLRGGTCVSANCTGSSSVIPGLGVCLSELVQVSPSGTSSASPLPSVSGLTSPAVITTGRRLAWWEILLMALGCAFIFLLFVMCWRRRMRKVRAKRTQQFAQAKALTERHGWRWRLLHLFGHRRGAADAESEQLKLMRLRDAEEARHHIEMEKIMTGYEHSRAGGSSRSPSPLPSLHSNRLSSGGSLYSQITGMPSRQPEPRQPVRQEPRSRFSVTTTNSSAHSRNLMPPTEAEAYALSVKQLPEGEYWLQPMSTGGSKNPFWK